MKHLKRDEAFIRVGCYQTVPDQQESLHVAEVDGRQSKAPLARGFKLHDVEATVGL